MLTESGLVNPLLLLQDRRPSGVTSGVNVAPFSPGAPSGPCGPTTFVNCLAVIEFASSMLVTT